jgi:hypothetical protein
LHFAAFFSSYYSIVNDEEFVPLLSHAGQLGNQSWDRNAKIIGNRLKRGMGWTDPEWCGRRYITLELLWTGGGNAFDNERENGADANTRAGTHGAQNEADDVNAMVLG